MKYAKGETGRVFAVNFEHGEDLLGGIREVIIRENVGFASIMILGAFKKGNIVAGPRGSKLPAEPCRVAFDNAWETVGFGTIVKNGTEPEIHIHCSFGKERKVLTGCLRDISEIFITIEAIITEIRGVPAERREDPATGHRTLQF